METFMGNPANHTPQTCNAHIMAIRDALYVLNGKWKLPLLMSLSDGPKRFKEIQRALEDITPKILSKELKELEMNEFLERKVQPSTPVTVTYELTPYSQSLDKVLHELREWGMQHRKRIIVDKRKQVAVAEDVLVAS